MYIILTYDIGKKRVGKVLKICRKYLVHVQKSVFEGQITPKKMRMLCDELGKIIQTQDDSIAIYQLETHKYVYKLQIGKAESNPKII